MASTTSTEQPLVFFPTADAAILLVKPPPEYPQTVGPVYDPDNVNTPILPWSSEVANVNYPPQEVAFAPAVIPDQHCCLSDRYLRATLTKNERFRLSMVWYYTREIFQETEFLSGLQEKVCIAQESIGWDFAIIGILDVNYYTRLATVGVPLGILPRGETICAHTVAQPPGSVFLLPDMLEDWRFAKSPYVESGGLRAYAGAPLRLQNEAGLSACLGSICVTSPTSQAPLTRLQQAAMVRLADWVVSDLVHLTRARRQRVRSRMVDLIAAAKMEVEDTVSEEPIIRILRAIYTDAVIQLQSSKTGHIEAEGRDPVPLSGLSRCLWEDVDHIDRFIAESNHLEPPTDRVVRIVAAQCDSVSGQSFLTVGTKDFRLVFDDIDAWFVQTCAGIMSEMWHKRLLAEVMLAKEKFLRGFSHQLRTPVHGILGSVELLAEELKSRNLDHTASQAMALLTASATATASARTGDEPIIYLDTIKKAGRDLISIINSMITLNRWADIATTERQYATHTLYDLENELWDEARKSISGDSRCASIVFAHHLPPDQCSIRTDLGLLRDSLLPLVINALQNTPIGSVVIDISARTSTKELIIDVKDEGRGIPAQDCQRIFELYEQVDVYATGAGIGLTLAAKFAALLQGSVELVSSEIDCGSHFRATFQGVDLIYSEPSSEAGSAFSQLTNIPKRFHNIASNSGTLSLCEQFAKFLTCYGFSPSDNTEDCLIIIDSVVDRDQHHAALSQFSPEQAVICLVPYSEGEHLAESGFKNVIYVDGPFLTSTMSYALEQADRFLASTKAARADSVQSHEDTTVDSQTNESADRDNVARYANRIGGISSTVNVPRRDESSPTDEATSTLGISDALGTLKTLIRTMVDREAKPKATQSLLDPLPLRNAQLPRWPAVLSSPDVGSDDTSHAISEPEAVPLSTIQSSRTIPVFPSPASTSHPTALLVDDNAINLRIMRMYCEKRSLPYLCARDGLEAVSLFQSHQTLTTTDETKSPIQLIFMDLQMPHCDGIEASRRIRRIEKENDWGESTLFVVTGQDSPTDRKAVANVGGQEYYVKPFSMKSLDVGLKKYFPLFKATV